MESWWPAATFSSSSSDDEDSPAVCAARDEATERVIRRHGRLGPLGLRLALQQQSPSALPHLRPLVSPTLPPSASDDDFLESPMAVLSSTLQWEERAPLCPPELRLKARYSAWLEESRSRFAVRGHDFIHPSEAVSLLDAYSKYGQPTAFCMVRLSPRHHRHLTMAS